MSQDDGGGGGRSQRGAKVDCVMNDWSAWGTCSNSNQIATRTIKTAASGGGTACGSLTKTQTCTSDRVGWLQWDKDISGNTFSNGAILQW